MNLSRASAALVSASVAVALACGGPAQPPAPGQETAPAQQTPPARETTPTAPGDSAALPDAGASGSAALAGRVKFAGKPPARRPIKMSGEAACHRPGAESLTQDVIVNPDGMLANAWVRVVGGLGDRTFPPPDGAAAVDQQGCLFSPHVLMAQTGQPIKFGNSDPVLHNINALAKVNRGFNLSLPSAGMSVTRTFNKPEAVRIKCDVHAWMGMWIVVHDSPYQALTGDDGAFEIAGLPAGAFVVEAWHEALGTARQAINVADGERREIEFSFSRPAR